MPNNDRVLRLIESIENDLRTIKGLVGMPTSSEPLAEGAYSVLPSSLTLPPEPTVFRANGDDEEGGIEGIFTGEHMVDHTGKIYQVAANYASKSKLVEGDPLKLYITPDGKFFFKQLGPVPRRSVPGVVRMEGNHYVIDCEDGVTYNVLTASVTYFMSIFGLRPGGQVMALVPDDRQAQWAAIDNIL